MRLFYILLLFPILNCTAQHKLKIETILSEPIRVSKENPETGRTYQATRLVAKTTRLASTISLESKNANNCTFLLQGNISSAGHAINRVQKIRFEKGDQVGDNLTLKYYVEIKHLPGKESANVLGYNYAKIEKYTVPKDVKTIHIELYEDRINKRPASKQPKLKLVAQQTYEL